jgi:hypothetical protein
VANLIDADGYATRTGRRLSVFVTVRWGLTALGETDIGKRWTRALDGLRQWAARRGIEIAYVWTHENPSPGAFNTHALVHSPLPLGDIEAWLCAHLDAQSGAIYIRPRTRRGGDPQGSLLYMMKGTDMATAMRFGLIGQNGRWKARQGIVPFKRSGTSNNIGKVARARYEQARDEQTQ